MFTKLVYQLIEIVYTRFHHVLLVISVQLLLQLSQSILLLQDFILGR